MSRDKLIGDFYNHVCQDKGYDPEVLFLFFNHVQHSLEDVRVSLIPNNSESRLTMNIEYLGDGDFKSWKDKTYRELMERGGFQLNCEIDWKNTSGVSYMYRRNAHLDHCRTPLNVNLFDERLKD